MTRNHFALRAAFAFVAVAATVGLGATRVHADPGAERHCVVEVVGEGGGTMITGPERCFNRREDADAYDPAAERAGTDGFVVASSSDTIGRHFTGTSFTGSSIRIVGTVCAGGVWYPTSTWNNNIESSEHHCGSAPTTFYDYSTCGGSTRTITSLASTLGDMNNRASCVRYG